MAPTNPSLDDNPKPTALLVLADGTVIRGRGLGAEGKAVGEVCFNTSMTGYQEIMTDPSYAGQIITFTFPHIGNTGANPEDIETTTPAARGAILATDITEPANWRAAQHFDAWLRSYQLPAIAGIDTRALTRKIRDGGAPNGVIAHNKNGAFDIPALIAEAKAWPGLDGMDLAKDVTCRQTYHWDETTWKLGTRLRQADRAEAEGRRHRLRRQAQHPALPLVGRLRRDRGAGDRHRRRCDGA